MLIVDFFVIHCLIISIVILKLINEPTMLGIIWLLGRLWNDYFYWWLDRYIYRTRKTSIRHTQLEYRKMSITSNDGHPADPEHIPTQLQQQFESAAAFVRQIAGDLGNDDLLYLYARYKQAHDGPCDPESAPSLFKAKERQKWNAWHNLGIMRRCTAMQQYVDHVVQMNKGWTPETKTKANEGMGLRPSRMLMEEGELDENGKPVTNEDSEWFAAVKDGDCVAVKQLMVTHDVNEVDNLGMNALHWACDRGHSTVVAMLLQLGIDVNQTDSFGQTALHFAASCDYDDVVALLLANGADRTVKDHEGWLPIDMATDSNVKIMLK